MTCFGLDVFVTYLVDNTDAEFASVSCWFLSTSVPVPVLEEGEEEVEKAEAETEGEEMLMFITAMPNMPLYVPVHPGWGGCEGARDAVTACGCGCGWGNAIAIGDAWM